MKRTTVLSAMVAAGALLLAGCGDDTAGTPTAGGAGSSVSAPVSAETGISGESSAGGGETGMSGESSAGGGETGMSGESSAGGGETGMSGESSAGGSESGMPGASSAGGGTSATLDADTENWFDTFCTSMAPAMEITDLQSKLDPSDLAGTLTAVSDAFGKVGAAFSDGAEKLTSMPAPTFDGGEEFADKIVTAFGDGGSKFTEIADKIAAIDPTDAQAIQAELMPAMSELQSAFEPLKDMQDLKIDPAVSSAIAEIPSCQVLQGAGG